MCVCVYVRMCVRAHTHTSVVCVHDYLCAKVHVHVHVHVRVRMHVSVQACVFVCVSADVTQSIPYLLPHICHKKKRAGVGVYMCRSTARRECRQRPRLLGPSS